MGKGRIPPGVGVMISTILATVLTHAHGWWGGRPDPGSLLLVILVLILAALAWWASRSP